MEQVVFDVAGYPPAKSEAQSIFGAAHPHAERVRRLLEAARTALRVDGQEHLGNAPLVLDVAIFGPTDRQRSDATNYLGGIADVLQRKAARGALDHLGDLANIDLFDDDRQIDEVHYKFEQDDDARYRVRLAALPVSATLEPPESSRRQP